jgi:Secretion system C-terminal sorting domain
MRKGKVFMLLFLLLMPLILKAWNPNFSLVPEFSMGRMVKVTPFNYQFGKRGFNDFEKGSLHIDVFANGVWDLDIVSPAIGDKGNTWLLQNIDVSAYAGKTVYFRFRGLTGLNQRSDMAIDDIGIVDSAKAPNLITTLKNSFSIYPNPTSNFIEIYSTNKGNSFNEIEIDNQIGEVIYNKKMDANFTEIKVDMTEYAAGVYLFLLKNNGRIMYEDKVIRL